MGQTFSNGGAHGQIYIEWKCSRTSGLKNTRKQAQTKQPQFKNKPPKETQPPIFISNFTEKQAQIAYNKLTWQHWNLRCSCSTFDSGTNTHICTNCIKTHHFLLCNTSSDSVWTSAFLRTPCFLVHGGYNTGSSLTVQLYPTKPFRIAKHLSKILI